MMMRMMRPFRAIRKIIILLLLLLCIEIGLNYKRFYESTRSNPLSRKNSNHISDFESRSSKTVSSENINYLCRNQTKIDIDDPDAWDYINLSKTMQKPKYDRCNLTDQRQRTFLTLEDVAEKLKSNFNGSELYKVKLDFQYILDITNSSADDNVKCYLQLFVKKISMSKDKDPLMVEPKYYFESKHNYELQLSQHGFYYFECTSYQSNEGEFIFRDLLTILPWNFTKLTERANEYDHLVQKITSNYTDSKTNPVFSDVEYAECLSDKTPSVEPKMNMFLLLLDSVSYEHFARVYPVTFKYLNEELDFNVLFSGVNRVGEKTYPNLLALTAGIIEHDIDNEFTVYNKIDYKWFDTLPLVWKDYKKLGYFTMYLQENPKIGPFHYNKRGFKLDCILIILLNKNS
jgi:hypothetical protein